jgi:hypothetical protein
MSRIGGTRDRWIAAGIVAALLIVYNANGREIGSYDSQPNKFAARELLLRRTLTLNHVVGAQPQLGARAGVVLCSDGGYRAAYAALSAVAAAAISYPFWRLRLIDPDSALAPSVIAVLGASLLTAMAVALMYLTARRRVNVVRSLAIAAGLGLGTGLWYLVSKTLWEHETAIFGLAIAVSAFTARENRMSSGQAIVAAVGLAIAGLARPQLAPLMAIVLAGVWYRAPRRAAIAATLLVGGAAAALMRLYWLWFGDPFGALSVLQDANNHAHATAGWIDWSFQGLAGLLVSPSRGILVFSPVVAIALAGVPDAARASWSSPLRWCGIAAAVQFLVYGSYSVWWAGHTYGPRYLLDVLPLLVPLAAAALARLELRRASAVLWSTALGWSIAVSATGAFFYPNDEWNTSPVDVDRHHERLWSWSDPQFVRCWREGPSPQNFQLFSISGATAHQR